MFATLYFPFISALASTATPKGLTPMLRDGRVSAASNHMKRLTEACEDKECLPLFVQLQADLQLTLGLEVDAEDAYRESQKLMRGCKREVRMASSRNTGWQAFHRHRFGTAMACFMRVVDEPDVDPRRRVEGLFGTLCVLYELGHLRDAANVLDEMEADVVASFDQYAHSGDWHELIDTLRVDIATQRELRSNPQLSDHVYWHSSFSSEPGLLAPAENGHARRIATLAAGVRSPLLRGRIDFLANMRRLAAGEREAMERLNDHLQWATSNGMVSYLRALRTEISLASLAGNAAQMSEAVLAPLAGESRAAQGHRHLEYLYCMAKTRQIQGRSRDSMQLYSRYAFAAMQCVRDESRALTPYAQRSRHQTDVLDDDVAARLPAKYRRAYRYLLDNLERSDLSVREVAAEVGVTERALQSAFKNSLGATPTEVIRQQRMERIHAALQSDAAQSEQGVLDVANKWGVQNRSTLANGYRRQFNEAPSETLKR
jgi:AraC-like DNA-binding protein